MDGNCTNWFYLCLAILVVFAFLFIMLLGYNLEARKDQIKLSKRTEVLEKKNGYEQHQINQLQEKMKCLEKKLETK